MLQNWIPNTIPLPFAVYSETAAATVVLPESRHVGAVAEQIGAGLPPPEPIKQEIDALDNFSKGQVFKYFPNQGYGFVKDRNGKDVYFNLKELDLVGGKGKDSIRKDIVVGFDASWTSHGMHIKRLKVY